MPFRGPSCKGFLSFLSLFLPSEPIANDTTVDNGQEARGAKRRCAAVTSAIAHQSVADDGVGTLTSSKLHRPFKCLLSHLSYHEI